MSSYPPGYLPVPIGHLGTRPPVLGGIAISGIIIAGFSVLASLLTAGYGAGVYVDSNSARERILRNAMPALPVSAPGQSVLLTVPLVTPVGERGMEAVQRSAVMGALSQKFQMTPEQLRQLEALLAEDGLEVFGPSVSAASIQQAVGDRFGNLPAAGTDAVEPFFFETDAGRAEVYADHALFYRKNTLSPLRATAGRRVNSSGHPVLLPEDVDALVRVARQSSQSDALNDPQVQTLRSLLADPKQSLVALTVLPDGSSCVGIQGARSRPDGYATIDFGGGSVLLEPNGNVILQADRDAIPAVNGAACALVIAEAILSIGLAVFLLIFSIRLLRHPRQKLRPLLIWAVVKMLLAVVAGLAMGWMIASFLTTSLHGARSPANAIPAALLVGFVVVLVGCAYPVVLVIAARSRGVREYYNPTA